MTAAYIALYGLGFLVAASFLIGYRPRQWATAAAWNATGWILITLVTFARGLLLIALHGGVRAPQGWGDALVSVGSLAAVDALLLVRLVSFARFRREGVG